MMRKVSFWKFYFYFVTLCAVGNTVISLGRDMALGVGATGTVAALSVGLMSLCNGLGRVISGIVYDALGRKKAMTCANVLEFMALAMICLANIVGSIIMIIVGFCLAGLSYGFAPTITASVIGTYFGEKNFSSNFSVANTLMIPTSFLAGMAGAFAGRTGSYTMSLIMLIVLAAISLVLNLSVQDDRG